MQITKRLVGIAAVFAVINLVLWVAQESYYHKDTTQINEIKAYLQNEKAAIVALETKLTSSEAEIERQQNQLDSYQAVGNINASNAGVDSFNTAVIFYKADVAKYNDKVTAYNAKVEEANAIIKESGTTWYLIPIPLHGKTAASKL